MSRYNVNLLQPTLTPPRVSVSSNAMAKARASADPRFNVKQFDRPGMSRGRGSFAQAGIAAANNLSAGVADAYGQALRDADEYADADLRMNMGRERSAQALQGLMSQANTSAQSDALQRHSLLFGLMGDLLR